MLHQAMKGSGGGQTARQFSLLAYGQCITLVIFVKL
jgi:hypothetical protein